MVSRCFGGIFHYIEKTNSFMAIYLTLRKFWALR